MACANPPCLSGEQVLQLGLFVGGVLAVGMLAMVLLTTRVGRPPGDTSQDVMRAKARTELMPLDLPDRRTPAAEGSSEQGTKRAGPIP